MIFLSPMCLPTVAVVHNSSLISLLSACSCVSHNSTFPPGNCRLLCFLLNNDKICPASLVITHCTYHVHPSSVCANHSFQEFCMRNLTVIAGSCLSLYPSLISEFDNAVAQLGQYHWIANHLYTRFCLYILENTHITDSINSKSIVKYALSISAHLPTISTNIFHSSFTL